MAVSSEHLSTANRDELGRLLTDKLSAPIVDSLKHLDSAFKQSLLALAHEPREKGKISRELVINALLQVCKGHYVTLPVLATLLHRNTDALRQQYLKSLVREGRISLAFPDVPTDPRQAYKTIEK